MPRLPIAMLQARHPSFEMKMTLMPLSALPAYDAALIIEFATGTFFFGIVSSIKLKMSGSAAAQNRPSTKRIIARTSKEFTLPVTTDVRLQAMQASASIRLRFFESAALPK